MKWSNIREEEYYHMLSMIAIKMIARLYEHLFLLYLSQSLHFAYFHTFHYFVLLSKNTTNPVMLDLL